MSSAIIGMLIVACFGLIGLEVRRRLSVRAESLEMIREYLRLIKKYISHTGIALDDIVQAIYASQPDSVFYCRMNDNMAHGFPEAFARTVEELRSVLCLSDDDAKKLSAMVTHLASFDMDGALSCLELADVRLSEAIASARVKCETDGRLYLTLGLAAGAVVALLVL